MSVQSGLTTESQNGHIWQNKDLDPNTTSIFYVVRKFLDDPEMFNEYIQKAENETKCSISIHGQNNKSELIWIKIKGNTSEARRTAFSLINEATNNSCNEIVLPKFVEESPKDGMDSFRLSSPSPPPALSSSNQLKNTSKYNNNNNNNEHYNHNQIQRQKSSKNENNSFYNSLNGNSNLTNGGSPFVNSLPNGNNSNKPEVQKKYETSSNSKKTLTRSSTENFISSYTSNNLKSPNSSSSPFGTVLSPLSPIKSSSTIEESNTKSSSKLIENENLISRKVSAVDNNITKQENNNNKNNKYKLKNRYTLDFLLLRADTPNSKTMPSNWKELNEKYPSVCFCGKVLSYFDPYKYYEHWEKTKAQNYELHSSSGLSSELITSKKSSFSTNETSQTDDYLNLKSTNYNKDYNNNNSFYKTRLNEQKPIKQRHDFLNNNNHNNLNYNYFTNETNNYYRKQQQLPFELRHQYQQQQQQQSQQQQQQQQPQQLPTFFQQENQIRKHLSKNYSAYN